MPKMIAHNFLYPLGHITTAHYWQKVEDGGRHLTVSDSGWAKFAWGKIYGQWICGAVNVAYDTDKFVPAKLLAAIDHLKLTTFCAPPTIYRFLIKEDMSGCDFSTIHHCGTAGEPLNPEVVTRFREGDRTHDIRGLRSDTKPPSCSRISAGTRSRSARPASRRRFYDIDIVDEDGNSCEDGIVGHIVIKNGGQHRSVCSWNIPATARLWQAHGRMASTTPATWHGATRTATSGLRAEGDDVIKCSGYRIGPFEVESALMTHPSVLECAVTAVPDPIRGQVVKATIVLVPSWRDKAGDELKEGIAESRQGHDRALQVPARSRIRHRAAQDDERQDPPRPRFARTTRESKIRTEYKGGD